MSSQHALRLGLTLLLVVSIAPLAHAQGTVSRAERNTSIRITYGKVVSIEETKLKSEAASGAVLGGLIGLVATDKDKKGGDKLKNAAIGAGVGAGVTKVLEGSNKAYAITVARKDGSAVKIIVDKTEGLAVGDCVSVEEGQKSVMNRVSRTFCGERDTTIAAPAKPAPEAAKVDSSSKSPMAQTLCDQAKAQLLQAKTKEEMDLAMAKIKALCQ